MCCLFNASLSSYLTIDTAIDTKRTPYNMWFFNVIGERAKRARHYQGCTNSSLCGIYIYICMEVRMPY